MPEKRAGPPGMGSARVLDGMAAIAEPAKDRAERPPRSNPLQRRASDVDGACLDLYRRMAEGFGSKGKTQISNW